MPTNMTFKMDIIPDQDLTYSLGSSDKRWKINDLAGGTIEYIVGTQTAATGSWKGVTKDKTLVTGKVIAYKLPYAGSGNASLTLTYTNPDSGAATTSSAIPVYLNNTRATTHYVANSVIIMVYDGTNWRSTDYWNSNSRDAGYGKISLTQSDATTALTTNTTQLTAGTYNEAMTLAAGNKWVQFAGTNSSTNGSDVLTVAHSLSGATAGNYGDSSNQTPGYGQTFKVPYISVDAAGHITSISEHNVTVPAKEAMTFKGTVAGSSSSPGGFTVAANKGDTYKVSTGGYVNGVKVEVGDTFICTTDNTGAATSSNYSTIQNNWVVLQTNIDGYVIGPSSSTTNGIATYSDANGKTLSSSGKTITTTAPSSSAADTTIPTSKAVWSAISGASGYGKTGTVTSVQVQASSPLQSSTNTAQSTSLNTTISFTNQNANTVLAGPSSGSAAAPSFRQLGLTELSGADDIKAIEALTGTSGILKKTAANTWTLDTNSYVTSSGVTSITIKTTSPVSGGSSTATTSTGTYTISLADGYGDTKNPYASKTKNYVLASGATANSAPSFRALVEADIPNLSWSKITSGNDDLKAIEALTGTSGYLQKTAANTWTLSEPAAAQIIRW